MFSAGAFSRFFAEVPGAMAWQDYLRSEQGVKQGGAKAKQGTLRRGAACGAPGRTLRKTVRRGASARLPTGRPLKLCGVRRTCGNRGSTVLSQRATSRRCSISAGRINVAGGALKQSWQRYEESPGAVDSLSLVGTAQETDCAHAARHPHAQLTKWAKVCSRCCYIRYKQRLGTKLPIWINSKPSWMPGAWGIGCTMCAAGKHSGHVKQLRSQHMRQNKLAGRCKQAISRTGVWSSYERRGFRTSKGLTFLVTQHESGDMHRLCSTVFNSARCHFDYDSDPRGAAEVKCGTTHSPQANRVTNSTLSDMQPSWGGESRVTKTDDFECAQPVASLRRTVGSVVDPFRGKVPQCQDWLDVWANYTSSMSTTGFNFNKPNFIMFSTGVR